MIGPIQENLSQLPTELGASLMSSLQALLRVHESFDKDELQEIADTYLGRNLTHLNVRQMKNVISLNLAPSVEVEYA